jgi:hypothetical protein
VGLVRRQGLFNVQGCCLIIMEARDEYGHLGQLGSTEAREVRRGIDYDCTGNVMQKTAKTKRERKTKINREERSSDQRLSRQQDDI